MTPRMREGAKPVTGAQAIRQGAQALGVALDDRQHQALLDYLALLVKWNRVYNLTAIRDPEDMAVQHILDSLSIVPMVAARAPRSILDVGSGGGLPGIVLAIVFPAATVTLNDIVHKKTAFLTQVKGQLALSNVTVITARVETLRAEDAAGGFDLVVSRAFADLADFVERTRHVVGPHGLLLAMKGQRPDDEIARLPAGASVVAVTPLHVPYLDAQRHLVAIQMESP